MLSFLRLWFSHALDLGVAYALAPKVCLGSWKSVFDFYGWCVTMPGMFGFSAILLSALLVFLSGYTFWLLLATVALFGLFMLGLWHWEVGRPAWHFVRWSLEEVKNEDSVFPPSHAVHNFRYMRETSVEQTHRLAAEQARRDQRRLRKITASHASVVSPPSRRQHRL